MAQGKHTIPFSKPTGFLRSPAGLSVEEARQQMLQEAEPAKTFRNGEQVPKFIRDEQAKANRGVGGNTPVASATRQQQPDIEDTITEPQQPARTATAERAQATGQVDVISPVITAQPEPVAVVPEPVRQPVQEPETKRTRIDDKKFTIEIFKEGKEWVAELTYKNGAGDERFTANSKDELLAKLAVGKANGTLKVRSTVQRYKIGDVFDQWDVFFNEVKNSHGLTLEQYNALPEQSRALIQDNIQAAAILEFKALYPEYYAIQHNFDQIGRYLNSRKVPLTLHNLELAYRDLSEDDELTTRPPSKEVVSATPTPQVTVPVAPPQTEDSVVEAPPAPAVAVPVAPVRKRGLTGLEPGRSSASPATETVQTKTEDGSEQRELSMEEARRLARENPAELARLAKAGRKYQRY